MLKYNYLLALLLLILTISCKQEKQLSYDEIIADFMYEYTDLTPEQVRFAIEKDTIKVINVDPSPGYKLILDDGTNFEVPANAPCLRMNDITLNVWRDGNSVRFYVVTVDERSHLATVFETWFCGESGIFGKIPAREVQRYIATGYIEGYPDPAHRHEATRRLEGKVIQWANELDVYGSPSYSAVVPKGSLQTFPYPTDYYKLDDRYWLYSRVEVEFSGGFALEVIDFSTLKKIGIRFGIDKADKFEFKFYTDKGKIRGQLAAYRPFGIQNQRNFNFFPDSAMRAMPSFTIPKGMRYLYRPLDLTKPMTLAEVAEVARNIKAWKGAFDYPGKEKKMMEHSKILDNRKFAVQFDEGTSFEYEIGTDFQMRFREGSGDWITERYDAFEADDQLVFFAHVTDSDLPLDGLQYAIDLKNGLVTCIRSTYDNEKYPRNPRQQFLFGVVKAEGITPSKERHNFTDELLGRSYTWEYSDEIASQHVYTTTESFSYAIISPSAGATVMGSFPCKYIKIRDGVYMMTWVEMRSQGIQGILLFNTKTMHDCGTCHGMTHDQTFEFNTFGAEARSGGQFF